MPELGTYGSLGGMARESCLYPEADNLQRGLVCVFAALNFTQTKPRCKLLLSKALCL